MLSQTVSWKKKAGLLALVAVFIFLLLFFLRQPLLHSSSFFQVPLVKSGTWISNKTGWLFSGFSFESRQQILEEERNALAVDQAALQKLKEENTELRAILTFFKRTSYRGVTASIIARKPSTWANTFLIDRGSEDGIFVGAPVLVGDGILVGKVASVTAKTATIFSITDKGVSTAAALLNSSQTIGLAKGQAGVLIALDFIPQDEEIAVNNLAVTSGLEENMPSGLLLGVVDSIKGDRNTPFKSALIAPLIDIRRQHTVAVLLLKD